MALVPRSPLLSCLMLTYGRVGDPSLTGTLVCSRMNTRQRTQEIRCFGRLQDGERKKSVVLVDYKTENARN